MSLSGVASSESDMSRAGSSLADVDELDSGDELDSAEIERIACQSLAPKKKGGNAALSTFSGGSPNLAVDEKDKRRMSMSFTPVSKSSVVPVFGGSSKEDGGKEGAVRKGSFTSPSLSLSNLGYRKRALTHTAADGAEIDIVDPVSERGKASPLLTSLKGKKEMEAPVHADPSRNSFSPRPSVSGISASNSNVMSIASDLNHVIKPESIANNPIGFAHLGVDDFLFLLQSTLDLGLSVSITPSIESMPTLLRAQALSTFL
jgi:hypothetical protein